MNKTVIYSVVSFLSGAAISGFVVWRILEPKYKKIADEEIASVKERFTVPKPEPKPKEKKEDEKTLAEKENDEYDSTNLTFYADGILAYDDGKDTIVDDVEALIGDALEHIGDYEDDSVHVVNHEMQMYYEILTDPRSYEDATKKKPNLDDKED